jgi:hypothetical protein
MYRHAWLIDLDKISLIFTQAGLEPLSFSSPGIWDCRYKPTQLAYRVAFKRTEIYYLTVLEARSPKIKGWPGPHSL